MPGRSSDTHRKENIRKRILDKTQRSKKLDEHNAELKKKGLTPRQTTFQTEKQYLRDAIDTVASQSTSQEEFSRLLSEKYNITFKVSRGRYSYLHPNRQNCLFLTKLMKPHTLSFL